MFRFTLRDVLWLMVVVGLSLGWWAEHKKVGQAPGQLKTLIDILASQDISVSLYADSVGAQGPLDDEKGWVDYRSFGRKKAVLSDIRGP